MDAKGTRAASVTAVEVESGEEEEEEGRSVIFNKPYIYMIVDMETLTPLFAGILNEVPEK